MKANFIAAMFIIFMGLCLTLTLSVCGYLLLQNKHQAEKAEIEAAHAGELDQLGKRADRLTARVEKMQEQERLYIRDIANLKRIAVFFRDRAIEEYYLGKFNMCRELGNNASLCGQIVVKSWHRQEHKLPPPITWDWEGFKASSGEPEHY